STNTDMRGTRTIAGYVLESLQDERAGIALAEVFEHEGGRPHRCHGVSDPTPGDLRRRSVDGLEERGIPPGWVEVRRGGQPKRTLERSPKVGQDIGVEVARDDNVQRRRVRHHACGRCVYVVAGHLYVREALGDVSHVLVSDAGGVLVGIR